MVLAVVGKGEVVGMVAQVEEKTVEEVVSAVGLMEVVKAVVEKEGG